MTYGIVSLRTLYVDSMESRPGLETAAEYDDEQLEALLSAIGADVTKAKQSLEANIRGVDDALEDLFVRGDIYATDNERSMVDQEPVAYLPASNIEIPAIIDVLASTSDASTPVIAESSQRDLCRTCGAKVCNDHFTALRGLKGQCLHCHILYCDPDPVDTSRDAASSVISELTNDDDHHHDSHDINNDIDHDIDNDELVAAGEFTNSDDDDDEHDDIDNDIDHEVANDEDHDINYYGDRDHDIDYDDDRVVGATMSDSAPRLLSPVNRSESNGEHPAVLEQAPEEDSVEEESAEEDSIEEEKPLEEEEEWTYLSSTADERPQAEIRFVSPLQHADDHDMDHDDVVNGKDHDGMHQSQHGHPRTFLASPPVWLWLETVGDESELLIIPDASRLDRIMETLTSDTSSLPSRRTKRFTSTRGQYRGAQDAQHSYKSVSSEGKTKDGRIGDLTRSVISKGNGLTQSLISKGKKKARGLMVVGLNTVR